MTPQAPAPHLSCWVSWVWLRLDMDTFLLRLELCHREAGAGTPEERGKLPPCCSCSCSCRCPLARGRVLVLTFSWLLQCCHLGRVDLGRLLLGLAASCTALFGFSSLSVLLTGECSTTCTMEMVQS